MENHSCDQNLFGLRGDYCLRELLGLELLIKERLGVRL